MKEKESTIDNLNIRLSTTSKPPSNPLEESKAKKILENSGKELIKVISDMERLKIENEKLTTQNTSLSQKVKQSTINVTDEVSKRQVLGLIIISLLEMVEYDVIQEANFFLKKIEYSDDYMTEFEALMDKIQLMNVPIYSLVNPYRLNC